MRILTLLLLLAAPVWAQETETAGTPADAPAPAAAPAGEPQAAPGAAPQAAGAPAQAAPSVLSETEVARRAHGLSSAVMSPFCPGRTLADCPSPDAAAVREEMRALLATGVPEDEVRSMLESRFGDVVLGVPRSAWGWILPVIAIVAGLIGLIVALRRLSRRSAPREDPGAEGVAVDAELVEELDRTLREEGL